MGTCFLPNMAEARGIDNAGRNSAGADDPSSSADAVSAPVNDAVVPWVNAADMRLSGSDWQETMNRKKQHINSFIDIGFQLT